MRFSLFYENTKKMHNLWKKVEFNAKHIYYRVKLVLCNLAKMVDFPLGNVFIRYIGKKPHTCWEFPNLTYESKFTDGFFQDEWCTPKSANVLKISTITVKMSKTSVEILKESQTSQIFSGNNPWRYWSGATKTQDPPPECHFFSKRAYSIEHFSTC